jgi:hypothetical protein
MIKVERTSIALARGNLLTYTPAPGSKRVFFWDGQKPARWSGSGFLRLPAFESRLRRYPLPYSSVIEDELEMAAEFERMVHLLVLAAGSADAGVREDRTVRVFHWPLLECTRIEIADGYQARRIDALAAECSFEPCIPAGRSLEHRLTMSARRLVV